MDLQFFAGEKTEKATPKKREDERKKGKVARSQDVNTAILIFFCLLCLYVFGGPMLEVLTKIYEHTFTEFIHWEVTPATIEQIFSGAAIQVLLMLAPIALIGMMAGVCANLLQIGFLFTTDPLKFDLKKIDPIKGMKRIFSVRALVELLKSLLKVSCIGTVAFGIIWFYKDNLLMTGFLNAEGALSFFGNLTIIIGISAVIVLFILAVFDYAYQRYDYEKNMRMSKQDIKDEFKNMEGDPLVKSQRQQRQKEISSKRMMSEVPNADVVITNPTHYAIALKYDEEKAHAPYVLAKGADEIAEKIKEVAKKNDVITVENRKLTQSLYRVIEIGDVIPEEFYQAVAEILAYVYRMEKKF